MFLDGNRWVCSACAWQMPNREICPRCWAPLPEDEGEGGEKICPDCGYELWPPRDEPPEPREVWYHPPGMEPYKVGKPRPVNPAGPPKPGRSGRRRGRYRSSLQRRMDDWKRRRRQEG